MYDIRPRQGISGIAQMTMKYGDQLADSIVKTGERIEAGLKQLTTQRELRGLSASLSQLNPQTPEYTQQLIGLGAEYPLAMQDPRGQAMIALGAKANANWMQTQRAIAQSDLVLNRQKTMEGIRQQNRITNQGQPIDFSGDLPSNDLQFGTDEAPENVPLFGMRSNGLTDVARSAMAEERAVGKVLQDQGVRLTPKDFQKGLRENIRGKIISERQQQGQEFRETEAEKARKFRSEEAEKAREATEASRGAREERAEQRLDKKFTAGGIKAQLDNVGRDITRQSRMLENVLKEQAKKGDLTEADHAMRTQLQAELQALGEERTLLEKQFRDLGGESDVIQAPSKTRIIERGGRKFEVDDETKKVLREVK